MTHLNAMAKLFGKIKYLFFRTGNRGLVTSTDDRPYSPYVIDLRKIWMEEIARSVYESQRLQRGLPRIH